MTHRRAACYWILFLVLGVVLAAPSPTHAGDYSYARVVRLSLVDGSVSIAHTGDQAWQPALANMPVQEGDTLASGAGRAEVEFENGAVAFLAENSILQFTQLALSGGGRLTQITLTEGTASFYGDLSSADSFEVLSPSLSVTLTGHAEFRVRATEGGSSVSVFKGTIEVNSSAGTSQVRKGESLSLTADDTQDVSVAPNPKADDFDRWVNQESEVIALGSADSLSYMNSPNAFGAADLYSYGSWFDCSSLGPCWQPFGIAASWSPYMDGFWSAYPGFGWTWISYEPWGWMPYHFGGWMVSPDFGWVWVPGDMGMWQPALVSWVTVGNQVGWVPLSPLEKAGAPPANLRRGVIVNPGAPNSPVAVAQINRVVIANGQTRVTQIAHPPATFTSATAPRRVAISSPFSAQGSRGMIFDRTSHNFVNAPPASMYGGTGANRMSHPAPGFATRPMGPPPGARASMPSARASGGAPASGGGAASPSAPATSATQGPSGGSAPPPSSGGTPHH